MTVVPVSDPIAVDVTQNMQALLKDGAVQYCGWVMVDPDPAVADFRIYTSPSFDRWLEVPVDQVLAQLGPSFESQGRSYVWVTGTTPVKEVSSASAVLVGQLMQSGGDPGAYPHGR